MNKEDRRVRKTKNALISSLMNLLNEKRIQSITVTDICRGANVNRSTFYQYYNNPFDMLEKIEEDIFRNFIDKWEKPRGGGRIPPETEWLEIIYQNRSYCKFIFETNGSSKMLVKLLNISNDGFQENLKTMHPELTQKDIEYICDFCSYGTIAIITKWVNGGFVESIEHIAGLISILNENALDRHPLKHID